MERIQESSLLKYRQIADALLQQIKGRPDFVLKSQRNLAAEFGVNRLTIQHALDWMEREGALVRLPGRGYVVSTQAPSGNSESLLVGWPLWVNSYGEIDTLRTHFRMKSIEETHRMLQSKGYQLDVQCVGVPHRPNLARIRELIAKWKLVILEPTEGDNDISPENPFYGMLDRAILIGALQGRKHNCVCPDFLQSARNAVHELARLGARRILFTGRSDESQSHLFLKMAGVESALDSHLELDILFAEGGAHFDEAYSAVKRFLCEGGECDAIISNSPMATMASCRVLADLGVRVPDDIQVIGIGGGSFLSYMVPRPTLFQSAPNALADSITRMAESLSHPKAKPLGNILVPMHLVKGETTRESPGGVAASKAPFVEGLRRAMKNKRAADR